MARISLKLFRRDDDHFIFSPFSAKAFLFTTWAEWAESAGSAEWAECAD